MNQLGPMRRLLCDPLIPAGIVKIDIEYTDRCLSGARAFPRETQPDTHLYDVLSEKTPTEKKRHL